MTEIDEVVESLAYDGKVVIGTSLDQTGFKKGIKLLTVAAASAVGVLAGYSVKVGMDFEEGMSKVSAISGAAGEDIAKLTEKAKEMGIKTKFSATEAASAMEYMAMAGWKTEDMLNGVEGIMNLAAASGEDLAMVSDIVTDALTAFGLSAKDSTHFADVLAAASSNANTNVALMGETFKYVAPVAGALGYSVEDTAVAIGLMANAGIKGSQAGTALRSIFSRLAKPTDEVAGAMNTLGINMQNADGSIKPLNELLRETRTAFSGLSDAQKAQYAAAIAGQEGMSGFLSIINASEADFEKLTAAIDKSDGSAQRMADTMQNNLKGQLVLLGSSMEGLGLAIYDGISGPLREAAEYAIDAVNSIAQSFTSGELKGALEAVGELFGKLVKVIINIAKTVIPAAINVLGFLGKNLKTIIPLLTAAASAFGAFKIITEVQNRLEKFRKVWRVAGDNFRAFAVLNNSASIAQAALNGTLSKGSILYGVVTKKISLATAAHAAWNAVVKAFKGPVGLAVTAVTALAAGITAAVIASDNYVSRSRETTKSMQNIAKATQEAASARDEEADKVQRLWEIMQKELDSQGNIIGSKERVLELEEEINAIAPESVSWQNENRIAMDKTTKAIQKYITAKKGQRLLDSMDEQYNKIEENEKKYTEELTQLKKYYDEADQEHKEYYQKQIEWKTAELKATQRFKQDYESLQQAIIDGDAGAIEKILSRYNGAVKRFGESSENEMVDNLASMKEQRDAMLELYGETNDAIFKDQAERLDKAMADQREEMIKGGYEIPTAYANSIHDTITEKGFKGFISGVASNIGKWIAEGTKQGLDDNAQKVYNAVHNLVKKTIPYAQAAIDAHSPSRKYRDLIGKMMGAGIGVGFDEEMKVVYGKMQRTLQSQTMRLSASVSLNTRRAAGSSGTVQTTDSHNMTNTIIIQQPVKSPAETARAVREESRRLARGY